MSNGVTKRPRSGKTAVFDLETSMLRGARVDAVFHDEVVYEAAPRHEREIDYSRGLDPTELRWAAAFRKVYNVGSGFFERLTKAERAAQIERTTKLAKTGRSVPAAKAAEVLATVLEYRLEDRVPSGARPKIVDFKTNTGRISQADAQVQLAVYRNMFPNIADVWRKS